MILQPEDEAIDANRCYLCGEEEENIDHLLIHYLKIRTLWSSLLTALEIAWMTKDVIISWNKIPLRKDDCKISRATLCCLFWSLWKERNKVVFEDEQFSLSKLKFFFVYSLCSWQDWLFAMIL